MSHCASGKALGLKSYCSKRKSKKHKTEKQSLLSKGDWHSILSRPIVEFIAGSWEDPIVDVEVTIIVFYSINSILVDAEWRSTGTFAAYHLLTFGGESQTSLVKFEWKIE